MEFGKHPTQKPETVIERLIRIGTSDRDLTLDCFAGTGITGLVAERLGRRWIMAESERAHIEIAEKRLKSQRTEGCPPNKPFPI